MNSRIVKNGDIYLLELEGGKQIPLYGYMTYQPKKARYEDFKEIGVQLFFCAVYACDRGINQNSGIRPFRPGFWKGYGEYDFSHADEDFRRIVGSSKPGEVYIIPRLMIESPSWWDAANPDDVSRDAQGTPLHESYASDKWHTDTEKAMEAFQNWITDSGWDKYIVGWHVACGSTEEFIRPCPHPMQYSDYSPAAEAKFGEWARAKYISIDALNCAWRTAYTAWDEVKQASPAQRIFAVNGELRDAEYEQQAIDTYTFINETMAQSVIRLCRSAKRVTGGNQVIGAFFGYTLNTGTEIGHHAAHTVLERDAVDFLASPFRYPDNRALGIDWGFQGSTASAMLHGKPWFLEADVRTCYSEPISRSMPFADPPVNRAYDGPVWIGPDNIPDSIAQMAKAFARVLTHNTAIWWFDMWGGWYNQEELMDFQKKAYSIYRAHSEKGGSKNASPIAVFIDDAIFCEIAADSPYAEMIYDIQSKALGQTGTPYEMYILDDLPLVDPSDYRMALFVSCRHWDDRCLIALEKWKKDGRILAFTGPVDTQAASGVQSRRLPGLETPEGLSLPKIRFEDQPGDVVMKRAEDGDATEILRRRNDFSVFASAAVSLTSDVLRKLICAAGGQVYNFSGDCVYASEDFVAVHAAGKGIRRMCFADNVRLTDAFTGEFMPGNQCFIDIDMKFGETRLLKIEKEDSIF